MLLGYNTNGFAHHTLEDAIDILAELGYQAVALTPDVHHLPPFSTSPAMLRRLRARLETNRLAVVVETGARFLLDPRRKHRPGLLEKEPEGRLRRLRFLLRCTEIAAELGAAVVSVWSGHKPPETSDTEAWDYLRHGILTLCDQAARLGVRIAFEPEPGMWIESLGQWEKLRDALAHPALGLTLDTGHIPCTEEISPARAVRRHLPELLNLHLDDARGGVHEHLQIGEGELDWPSIFDALRDFRGVASVELSRHSHDAPRTAAAAIRKIRELSPA